MLHHSGQRHRKGLRQIADRQSFRLLEAGEQSTPGRVGKRGEGAIEGVRLTLNHRVKCQPNVALVKLNPSDEARI